MLLFSIDIGITNIGVCFYDSEKPAELLYADKISISSTMKELQKSGINTIIPRIQDTFFGDNKVSRMVSNADIILIEQQMKTNMKLVQYTIGSMCSIQKKQYVFVSPRSVKVFFNSGSASRNLKGKRNNYLANKKAAIAIATKLFPHFMKHVPYSKKDDVSDAILQAVFYSRKVLPKKGN